MKNITKYILAAAAAFSSLTACQEFEDFEKTIDGTPGLVYVQTGTENLYTIRVVHKPTGSTGEFFTEFPVCCNTTRHAGVKATFVYDASLVESYNAEHKTSYAALPAEYLTLENTTLTVPENATASADSVKVTLTGDLSLLTERNYLAPLRIKAEGIDASEVMGAVYVAVATEINLIRAIESTDDMVGFTATGRSAWTADCGNYANLFDGSTSTSVDFPEQYGNVLNIDMKEQQLVTGLCLGYGLAFVLGKVDMSSLNVEMLMSFNIPQPFKYGVEFNVSSFIAIGLVYLITAIEATGDVTANSMISGLPIEGDSYLKRVSGGVMADGFNSFLAGVFNSFPNSIFAQNNGIIQLTGVASRYVGYYIAAMLVLLGLFPIVGAVFSLMPDPVLGGATLLMFGTVAAAGIRIISSQEIGRKETLVLAVSLSLGLGVELMPDVLKQAPEAIRSIFSSGITTGGLTAIIANVVIRVKEN